MFYWIRRIAALDSWRHPGTPGALHCRMLSPVDMIGVMKHVFSRFQRKGE